MIRIYISKLKVVKGLVNLEILIISGLFLRDVFIVLVVFLSICFFILVMMEGVVVWENFNSSLF